MVHSTWGDWLVRREIEAVEPAGASLWYLGCNGFVLRSQSTTIYIDPYFGEGAPPRLVRNIPVPMDPADATQADAVLITHEHIDHLHPPSYGPLVDVGADLYAPSASFGPDRTFEGDLRAPEDRRVSVEVGESYPIGDFTVHVREANDPDAVEPVSYVVEHDAGIFFHPGDSRPADAFAAIGEEFNIDLGVLAYGSVGRIRFHEEAVTRRTRWYMDENDVIEAANTLELDRLAPSHWDMWRGMDADPKGLADHATSFEFPRVIERVTVGDRLRFGAPGIVPDESL